MAHHPRCRRGTVIASSSFLVLDTRRACAGMPHVQSLLCYYYSLVHPNPGPTVRVGQLNCAGLTKEKRLSLLRHAADVDVLLLQELKMSEREALSFTLPGFKGIGNPKGGGVAGRRSGSGLRRRPPPFPGTVM